MKPEHFIYKSDGPYYMQNVPEKPVANRSGFGMFNLFEYEYKLAEYKAAIERAKAEAVKVEDLELEVLVARHHYPTVENTIYTINMEEKKIEVVDIPCEGAACPSRWGQSCIHSKLIARIAAPKKEQESEHQWNIWREAIEIPEKMRGMEDYEVIQELEKHFEIKRKPL